jgi:drug/metabolite transporter (DMT)-like permease
VARCWLACSWRSAAPLAWPPTPSAAASSPGGTTRSSPTVSFAVGAVLFAPLAIGRGISLEQPLSGWVTVLYLGVVPSALAYAMYQRGLRHIPASTATILTLAEPLTAALLAWALFSERLTPVGLAGGMLLLASIVLLSRRGSAEADRGHSMARRRRGILLRARFPTWE